MTRYVAGRLVEFVVVVFVVSFLIYVLIGLMPGDPIDIEIANNPNMTAEGAALLRAKYGVDLPIWERYWNWLGAALQGDFGFSRSFRKPAFDVMPAALLQTLKLVGTALVFALAVAFVLGITSALRPGSKFDMAVNTFAFAGQSMPIFFFALLLMMLFSVKLGWLPAGGTPQAAGQSGLVAELRYLVLPVLALSLANIAGFSRFIRASMIETLRMDYIRTAKAKGASRAWIIRRHALRNALIPIITIVALTFGALFSGAVITETMFSYRGMGYLIINAIQGNDFNLALVALLFVTLTTLLCNLIADLLYAWVDPRISYD